MSRGRPSLRTRVTFAGVAVVTLLVLALNVFVYLSLRDRMMSNLEKVLDAREQLARELGRDLSAEDLGDRLDEMALRAVVRTADGTVLHSRGVAVPFDWIPAGGEEGEPLAGRIVALPDGGSVTVLASRAGIDATLDRLLILEAVGTLAVVALAYALLSRASAVVLRPVQDVSRTARHIAHGHLDERLHSDPGDVELAEMVRAFNEMLDALESALERSRSSEEMSRRFLADAAHQLRNPIAGMRASVATLLRTDDGRDRERMLDNLARESARTSQLLSSLLRVARLDSDEEVDLAPADLAGIAEEVVRRQQALSPHLRIGLDVHGEAVLVGDGTGLREALANLVDNAARHASGAVEVSLNERGGEVVVEVSDDGPGVPEHQRERIFERFVSLDGAGGSGLGLPIAQAIVELHGGSLAYVDGSFVVRIPLATPVATSGT